MIRKYFEKLKTFWKTHIVRDEFFLAREQFKYDNAEQGLRYTYPLNNESVVLDLGGYKGEWAQEIWDKYKCHLYIYEPVKSLFDEAVDRFKDNHKVKLFNFGLSDQDSRDLISLDGLASSQFIGKRSEEVEFKDAKIILGYFKKIDLIKINIEGGEFKVLPRMISLGLHNICDNLQIQFHHFYPNSEKLREEIRRELLKTHTLTYDYPFFFENYKKI